MNHTKLFNWKLKKQAKDVLTSYETKQKFKYIKGSLFAIILGLILAGIIIAVQNVNPFIYLRELFNVSFSGLFVEQTFQWISVYIVAALAVAIGFKSGMFNIGVSGQMLIGSGFAIIYYKLGVVDRGQTLNAGNIILIFLICMFSGAILSGIAGALKALFNIHEVVTTIMLNWTVWYLLKFIFTKYQSLQGQGINTSASMATNQLAINGSSIAIPIIIAVVCLIIVAIILTKTVFGYKLKAVGSSPNASKYAGFNVKQKMIEAMFISGALAGIASFINVLTLNPNISFTIDNLPATGYDAIAISLVAFNNPIGIFFTSFLWGILQSGGSSAASLFNMPNQTASLVFGIIVYFAAISVVFINYYPILRLRMHLALADSRSSREQIHNLRQQQWQIHKDKINWKKADSVVNYREAIEFEISETKNAYKNHELELTRKEYRKLIHELKNQIHEFNKEYRKNLDEMHKKISQQIKGLKIDTYVRKINSAKQGINRRQYFLEKQNDEASLNAIGLEKSNFINQKDKIKTSLSERLFWKKHAKHNLKNKYSLEIQEEKAFYQGQVGDATHYYSWFNGNIEIKGEIKKNKVRLQNKIQSLKADYRVDRNIIKTNKNLSHQQKHQQLMKLKNDLKVAIKRQKDIFKKFKTREDESLSQLTKDYHLTKKSTETIKTLTTLKKIHKEKLKLIEKNYKDELQKINQEVKTHKTLVDKKASKVSLQAMKKIFKQTQKKTKPLLKQKMAQPNLVKALELDEQMQDRLSKVRNFDISFIDSNHLARKKAQFLIKIAKNSCQLKEYLIATKNIDRQNEIRIDTKQIVKVYDKNLKVFTSGYKRNRKKIMNDKGLNYKTRVHLLNNAEREYDDRLQSYILDLEAKTRVASRQESEVN